MKEKITARDILGRLVMFILCGGVILLIYFISVGSLYGILLNLVEKLAKNGTKLPEYFWFYVYSIAYIFPLYFLVFLRDVGLKTEILHVTADGYDVKKVFASVYRSQGWLDHAIYAAYSLLMLLPFRDPFENPFLFISIQELAFFSLPVPRILSWFLAVLCFAVQYALCLLIVSVWWDKKRLHR